MLKFELSFRPPFDWPAVSAFLGARAIAGVEAVEGGCYRRTVRIARDGKEHTGWIEVALSPKKPALRVAVSASLARALPPVLSRVKALMDLACNPAEVAQALGALREAHPGLRVPGAFDGFEMAVRAILGQQVTVAAARTVAGRFAAAFGEPVATRRSMRSRRCFPTATRVAGAAVRAASRASACPARAPAPSSRSRARWRTDSLVLDAERRHRGDARRGCARCRAWANGPRSTSRCARSPGRMRFRTPIWA